MWGRWESDLAHSDQKLLKSGRGQEAEATRVRSEAGNTAKPSTGWSTGSLEGCCQLYGCEFRGSSNYMYFQDL